MGFLDSIGNFLGDITGWNQSQQGAQQSQQSAQAISQGLDELKNAASSAASEATYAQGRERGLDTQTDLANKAVRESIGANAAEGMKKARESASAQAGEEAAGAGQSATASALGGARTAGLSKGEAALQAGGAAGRAATDTYGKALESGENRYMQGAQQQQGAANALASQGGEAASRGLTSTGQRVQAGQAQGQIGVGEAQAAAESHKQGGGAGGGLLGGLLGAIGLEEGGEFTVPKAEEGMDATVPPPAGRATPDNPVPGGLMQPTQSSSSGGGDGGGGGLGSLIGTAIKLAPLLLKEGGEATMPYVSRVKSILSGNKGLDGVVPPGSPNDTFPILVSSGEHVKVTPADQVSDKEKAKAKPDMKSIIAKIKKRDTILPGGPVGQDDVNAMAAAQSNPLADLFIEVARRAK